jgi:hypothetical protein
MFLESLSKKRKRTNSIIMPLCSPEGFVFARNNSTATGRAFIELVLCSFRRYGGKFSNH